MVSNHPPHRVGAPDNPENPPEMIGGFSELIWQLKNYGFPIALDTVELVREYVEESDKPVEELDYQIVAQSLEQNNEDLNFDTRNEFIMSEERAKQMQEDPYW